MAISIPLGYYLPGDSFIHRCDPRVKITVLAVFAIVLFATSGWAGLLICTVILAVGYRRAKVPVALAAKGIKPLAILLLLTLVFNAFTFTAVPDPSWVPLAGPSLSSGSVNRSLVWLLGGAEVPESIALIGSFGIRTLGAINGVYFILRISLLIFATSLLTFTTSTLDLTDALNSIMSPLRHFKVPVEDFATMFSIALRFIPLTAAEVDRIVLAQRSRGAVFDEGSIIKRLRSWIPVLIPLFVNLFRRADQLACAMDSRCYRGRGRTHLRIMRARGVEIFAGIALSCVLLAIGLLL